MPRNFERIYGYPRHNDSNEPASLPNTVISYSEQAFVQPLHNYNNNIQGQMAIIQAEPIVVPRRLITIEALLAFRVIHP